MRCEIKIITFKKALEKDETPSVSYCCALMEKQGNFSKRIENKGKCFFTLNKINHIVVYVFSVFLELGSNLLKSFQIFAKALIWVPNSKN